MADTSTRKAGKRKRTEDARDSVSVKKTVRRDGCSQNETCPVCSDSIVDATEDVAGQEALFCEGSCKQWLHRWCAGVRQGDYEPLSSSQEPFVCNLCTIELQQKQIDNLLLSVGALKETVDTLQSSVAILKSEILQLKETRIPSPVATETVLDWQTVAKKKKRGNQKKSNKEPSKQGPPARPPLLPNSSVERGSLVEVPGARKIWGTVKATSSSAVLGTIKRLTSSGAKLSIKRKSQPATEDRRRERWWFILKGKEEDLIQLQTEWETVNIQTSWKIERVCYYSSYDGASNTPTLNTPHGPQSAGQEVSVDIPHVTPAVPVAAERLSSNSTTRAQTEIGTTHLPSLSQCNTSTSAGGTGASSD